MFLTQWLFLPSVWNHRVRSWKSVRTRRLSQSSSPPPAQLRQLGSTTKNIPPSWPSHQTCPASPVQTHHNKSSSVSPFTGKLLQRHRWSLKKLRPVQAASDKDGETSTSHQSNFIHLSHDVSVQIWEIKNIFGLWRSLENKKRMKLNQQTKTRKGRSQNYL